MRNIVDEISGSSYNLFVQVDVYGKSSDACQSLRSKPRVSDIPVQHPASAYTSVLVHSTPSPSVSYVAKSHCAPRANTLGIGN
jgi:hypothetical protein